MAPFTLLTCTARSSNIPRGFPPNINASSTCRRAATGAASTDLFRQGNAVRRLAARIRLSPQRQKKQNHGQICAAGSQHHGKKQLQKNCSNAIASPNGWWRDTAQRILGHRETVPVDRLAELCRSHSSAAVRVQSLYTFQHVAVPDNANRLGLLLSALKDQHPEVRRHALILLEVPLLHGESQPPDEVLQLVNDPSPIVRRQLAFSLGECRHRDAARVLATLLSQNAVATRIDDAVMTSLRPDSIGDVLHQAVTSGAVPDGTVVQLINQAAAMKNAPVLRQPVLAILQQLNASTQAETCCLAIGNSGPSQYTKTRTSEHCCDKRRQDCSSHNAGDGQRPETCDKG